MTLFDFILSLLLVFNPGVSDEDFNNVYSILDDTVIRSIYIDDSALDRLAGFSDSGIMPLDLTSQQSTWLSDIRNSVSAINSKLGTNSNTIFYFFSNMDNCLNSINNGFGLTASKNLAYYLGRWDNGLKGFSDVFNAPSSSYASRMYNGLGQIYARLGDMSLNGGWDSSFSVDWIDWFQSYSDWAYVSHDYTPIQALADLHNDLIYFTSAKPGTLLLGPNGKVEASVYSASLATIVASGFSGLARGLVGSDRDTTFSFLSEDITQGFQEVSVINVLDALGIMGTQLQNPLQRLAYVFANPEDLEIRENVSENQDSANENFFRPGSPGSVDSDQIGNAAGFASGAGDFLQAGGSPADAFAQLGQGSDNWGFFSQAAMDDMLGSPPPSTLSDDFGELGEDGLYHLLPGHLFEVDSMLGKGG